MLDYYSQYPAPSVEQRIINAKRELSDYSYLTSFDRLIKRAVLEVNPGSLVGYQLLGWADIKNKASFYLLKYKADVQRTETDFRRVVFLKIVFHRWVQKWRRFVYAPGNCMYNKVAKRTLVGKANSFNNKSFDND